MQNKCVCDDLPFHAVPLTPDLSERAWQRVTTFYETSVLSENSTNKPELHSMWPFGGATLVVSGLGLSAWHWLVHEQQHKIWHAAGCYALIDAAFVAGALLFLHIGIKYGETRGKARPAPYPGAWVEPDGHQQTPRGFAPGYLSLALVVCLIIPSLLLLFSSSATRPLACATLGPYLLVFIPQILLETKYLNRSFMTPVLPVLFMYYRLWQFIRSMHLVGEHWLRYYLLSLLAFWVFDTGCTMIWLPWMFDWQLQDTQMLQHISKLRQEQQLDRNMLVRQQVAEAPAAEQGAAAAAPTRRRSGQATTAGLDDVHGMTTRSKARTPGAKRRKAAGATVGEPAGADEIDTYGFGS